MKKNRAKKGVDPESQEGKFLYKVFPLIALIFICLFGFFYLFHEAFQKDKVMFSNDGPLGVMNSKWVREGYLPGEPLWNDSWWLGASHGVTPISFTTIIFYLLNNPLILLTVILSSIWLTFFYFYYYAPYLPKSFEPEERPDPEPQDRTLGIRCSRLLFAFICLLLYISSHLEPNQTGLGLYFGKIVGVIFLFYIFIGPVIWLSYEDEHKRFLEKQEK